MIIYFHGNGEDAGSAIHANKYLMNQCKASIANVEYPGYGMYEDSVPDEAKMFSNAIKAYDYFHEE